MSDEPWVWAEVDAQDEQVTLEGMASVRQTQAHALEAAYERLLVGLAHMGLGPAGPLDAGFLWDVDVHRQTEGDWLTLTLTWVGPADVASTVMHDWGAPGEAD